MKDFLEEVSDRLVLGDGDLIAAMETHGNCRTTFPEELNLSNPDAVTAAHAGFLSAGAEVLRTNSLHARADDLKAHGLENRLSEIHWLASQLAKAAARGTGALVAGVLSQENHGTPSAYQARVGPLLDGGADFILFENFTDLEELIMALHVKQALHHCPAICSLAWNPQTDFAQAFRVLENEGADVIGGPFETVFPMIPKHRSLPKVLLVSQEVRNSSSSSIISPQAYTQLAIDIHRAGGGLLLGGIGITSAHVSCVSEAVKAKDGP